MNPEERLRAAYHCPKCRSTTCHVRHVTIPVTILPLPVSRYLATTCALCGYTEFYEQAVFESLAKPVKSEVRATESDPAPET